MLAKWPWFRPYNDDLIALDRTLEVCVINIHKCVALLKCLCFVVDPTKSLLHQRSAMSIIEIMRNAI